MGKNIITRYTEAEIKDIDLPRKLLHSGKDTHYTQVTLDNGDKIVQPTRNLIMILIGLRAHITFGMKLNKSHFDYDYTGPAKRSGKFKIWSKYYTEILDTTTIDHREVVWQFYQAIIYYSNLVVRYMGSYQQSMSILSLARVQCDPKVMKITEAPLQEELGTDIVEHNIEKRTKELISVLMDPGALRDNVLLPFMWTGSLKNNQIPQQMIAYGTRSDIDDTMMKHPVKSSATRGIQNVTEYGIEGLSVKKAEHYKEDVIRESQYSARATRLNCAILANRYSGNCGSELLLPYNIPEKSAFNYIDKICYCNGELVHITTETLPHLIGEQIEMISPLGCRHVDGICARCAGRATSRPWAYIPEVHLGIYAATKVGAAVSQMVLSAKHLIRTLSIIYELLNESQVYFIRSGTDIKINPAICDSVKEWHISVPVKYLGHISASGDSIKLEESYQDVNDVTIIKPDGTQTKLDLRNERMSPYFSGHFLKYITKMRDELVLTEADEYIVPMKRFNLRWPVMRFNVINDDMVSYTKACDHFLKSRVANYSTATSALHDFASVIYSKTSINIFYLEVLLRTMLRKPNGEPGLPIVESFDNIILDGICRNIATHTLSQKLSFERLGVSSKSDGLLAQPAASIIERDKGLYDPLFGLTHGR